MINNKVVVKIQRMKAYDTQNDRCTFYSKYNLTELRIECNSQTQ